MSSSSLLPFIFLSQLLGTNGGKFVDAHDRHHGSSCILTAALHMSLLNRKTTVIPQ